MTRHRQTDRQTCKQELSNASLREIGARLCWSCICFGSANANNRPTSISIRYLDTVTQSRIGDSSVKPTAVSSGAFWCARCASQETSRFGAKCRRVRRGREAVTRHDDRRERDDVVGGGGGARWRGDGTIGSPSARDECDRQPRCLRLPLITTRAQNGVSRRRFLTSVRRFGRFLPGPFARGCG